MSIPTPDPEEALTDSDSSEPLPGTEPETPTAEPVAAPEVNPSVESARPEDGWSLIALVPDDGREPPASVSDELARSVWCAVSAIWHPSLLARARELPRIESIESPTPPGPREVRVVAGGSIERLPSGYRTQAEDAGAVAVRIGHRPRRADRPHPGPASAWVGRRTSSRPSRWPPRRAISWRSARPGGCSAT